MPEGSIVSNVIQFPRTAKSDSVDGERVGGASAIAAIAADPGVRAHAVQFYDDEPFLFDAVGQFLAAGLLAGDGLLVIARPHHRDGFLHRLVDLDVEGAIASGQLVIVDAHETLEKLMVGDMPDADRFRDVLAELMSTVQTAPDGRATRVRAYGEMVDVLWRDGNAAAALRLEELWNDAGKHYDFSLLCAYLMGHFYSEGDAARFMEVCRTHTHVVTTEGAARFDEPHARLRDIALLRQRARSLEYEIQHRKDLERALRSALEARRRTEEALRDLLKAEREARAVLEASIDRIVSNDGAAPPALRD
jgi:hypothetical protein